MGSHFVRCKNGHVYDANAYSSCPICSRAGEDYTQYKINSADAEAMTVSGRENTGERSIPLDMGDGYGSISEDVTVRYADYKKPEAPVSEGQTVRLADAGIAAAKVDPVSVVLQEDGREHPLQYQTEKVGGRIPLAPMPLERAAARVRSAASLPPGGSGRTSDAKLPEPPQKTERPEQSRFGGVPEIRRPEPPQKTKGPEQSRFGGMPEIRRPEPPQKTEEPELEMPDWMPKDPSGTDVLLRMLRATGADAEMTAPTPEEELRAEAPVPTPVEEPETEAAVPTPVEEPGTEAPAPTPEEEPETEAPAPTPEEEMRTEAPVPTPEEELQEEETVWMPEEPGTEVSAAKLPTRPAGWLVCVQGPDLGSSFLLREGKNVIGKQNGSAAVWEEGDAPGRDVLACVEYREPERAFYAHIGEGEHPVCVRLQKNDILYFGECALMLIPCCDGQFSWQDVR